MNPILNTLTKNKPITIGHHIFSYPECQNRKPPNEEQEKNKKDGEGNTLPCRNATNDPYTITTPDVNTRV